MEQTSSTPRDCRGSDPLSVPFWIVLSGVGVGAAWTLIGVAVGYAIGRRH